MKHWGGGGAYEALGRELLTVFAGDGFTEVSDVFSGWFSAELTALVNGAS